MKGSGSMRPNSRPALSANPTRVERSEYDSPQDTRELLSLLVLVCNEEENLLVFYERLCHVLSGFLEPVVEVIFIDDGSKDRSFEILQRLREKDPRIKILRLSRNFGSWNALVAGVRAASGDAVMWISSDLQDPPELIPQLLRHWRMGAHAVWGVRAERRDPWLRRTMAMLFYRLLRHIGLPEYPPLGMDICLMDRRVAVIFGRLREHNRFTQGLIMTLGFTQTMVPYTREHRHRGKSKWSSLPRLFKISMDMLVGVSHLPLRAMIPVGVLMAVSGIALVVALGIERFAFDISIGAWGVLIAPVLFLGGLNLLMMGILGEYLWRVLDEVRGRPLYIVQEEIGFESEFESEEERKRKQRSGVAFRNTE